MEQLNWLAVFVAAISAFVLGGLWYSPILFGKRWAQLSAPAGEERPPGNPLMIYGVGFLLSLAGAAVFSLFLGPDPELTFATGAGFSAGLFWVAGSFGINYLFEQKPFELFAINGSYHALQYTLYGLVLGAF